MGKGPRFRVPFRRRREGKTDYRQRLKLLKSELPRAVVRKTLNTTTVQFVEYHQGGDKVLFTVSAFNLKKYGWTLSTSNLPAAYLTGFLAGKKALKKGLKKAVLDVGLNVPSKGCKVFAALAGLKDAGVEIPHNKKIRPTKMRIRGEHINNEVGSMFDAVFLKIKEAN